MATVDDLRDHLLDDAIELMQTLAIVTPLTTTANPETPVQSVLRRLLSRHVILVLTRMHAEAGTGPSGITASIDGVLEAAANTLLSAAQIDHFKTRRVALQKDMEPDGVSFMDIYLFRNTELAHSLHPHSTNRRGLSWNVINSFAEGTYKLVQDVEAELVKSGAPVLRTLVLSENCIRPGLAS
jgi:hypothetical protein